MTAEDSTTNVQITSRGALPSVINRAQAYYWTRAWQAGEAESHRDLEQGDVMRFRDADSALRWLLSTDESH
jgi:hypothetical protein